jgi:protein-disulfide isomerase
VTAGTFKARVTVRKVALSVSLRCASCELRTLDLREAHGSVTVECYPKPASSLWGARLAITCGLAKNRRVGVAIQQDRGRKLDRRQQMKIPGAWARDLIVGVHGGNLFGSDRALRAFIAERTVFMQRTKRGGRRWDSPACVCRCWERDIGVTYPVSRIMVTSTQVFPMMRRFRRAGRGQTRQDARRGRECTRALPFSRRYIANRIGAVLCVVTSLATYSLQAQDVHSIPQQVEAAIVARPEMPAAGSGDADVTIVEFLDYNCPFCKKTAPELQKLLQADRRVRILYKEWPIFGDVSEYAARSALAANWQGKFLAAHNALIGAQGDLDQKSQVDSLLKGVGADLKRLSDDRSRHVAEIDAALDRSAAEAKGLGLRGTPGFLIGRQLVPTALTLPQLLKLTTSARKSQQGDAQAEPRR